ncbi:MAG: circularly permuted type 2 ATP-grasp protein [Isosphaeraceae bacterium]
MSGTRSLAPSPLTPPDDSPRPDLDDRGAAHSFDETFDPAEGLRPHWRDFYAQIEAIGLEEVRRRWEEAKHVIRENGVTYNVYGDPRGMDRPWGLDPIPLLISPHEAAAIETGLTQRARLIDRVLADIYGPQTLLTSGTVPAELVFGHPGFLRACHGLNVPGGRHLHLYAVDLGRDPNGAIHVLADRTQSPSGAGYALENRIVLSRMLPEVFRSCRIQRLALFFRAMRESLAAITPEQGNRDNPRIVLLTPGPYNETYFEHAYLARYLGYTLVEGGDLTVRDNRVYLKLLGGLQPVDVILRRLDDDYSDPLELRADSFLGVPGLVQAVRSGNVAVANTLGSGLLESPGWLAYLPAACRLLLGEDLKLPSVPTFWCGEPESLRHVLAHLHEMVVKPAFPHRRFNAVFGKTLDTEGRRALAEKIRARPGDYVAQEELRLSTTPTLVEDRLEPRHLVIRAFLTSNPGPNGYSVMPGGLTRFAAEADTLVVSMQRGGGSKDTWVQSAGPVSQFTLLSTVLRPVELSRGGGDLPSRAADDLFWLGRYAERVEGAVRLLRGILVRLTEKSGLVEVPELPSLLRALTNQTATHPGFLGFGAEERIAAPEAELRAVMFDVERLGSVAATIAALHRAAGKVRDRISVDMWRVLSGLHLGHDAPHGFVGHERDRSPGGNGEAESRRALSELLDTLDRLVITLAAFSGMSVESMTRGQAWRFLDMGRRLERSLHTLGLLRCTLTTLSGNEAPLLEALLEIADSSMTYRRRYQSSLQTAPVIDLLLADEQNPRSLAFQLVALSEGINHLPRQATSVSLGFEQRLMLSVLSRLRGTDLDQLAQADPTGHRPELERLLTGLEAELPLVSDTLTRNYLTHLQASRHFAS